MIKNFASSPATAKAALSQRGFITRAARRQRKDGEQPAAALFTPPPAGTGSVPVVKAGQIIRPQPDAEQKWHGATFGKAPAPATPGKARMPRAHRGSRPMHPTTEDEIAPCDLAAMLRAHVEADAEFERRKILVRAFAAVRQLGFSGPMFCQIMRMHPATLYNWERQARADGLESLRPKVASRYTKWVDLLMANA